MLAFIKENVATILVSLILLLIVVLILVKMVKDKRNGTSCHCGTDCGSCASASLCHGQQTKHNP